MDPLSHLNKSEQILALKAAALKIPLSGTFELTPLCNMNCRMCYIHIKSSAVDSKGGLLSVDEWLEIGRQAIDAGMLFLLITGGEPLVYPEFATLWEKLSHMGIVLTLNTNGTLVTEEIAQLLQRDMPRKVNISLYGASRETYQSLCGSGEFFDKTIQGIRLLKEHGIPVRIHTSITPENVHDIDGINRLAGELDCPNKFATYMFPPLSDRGSSQPVVHRLSPQDAADAYVKTLIAGKSNAEAYELIKHKLFIVEEAAKNPPAYKEQGMTCFAAKNNIWVNWKGELTPCGMFDQPAVPCLGASDGFASAWKEVSDRAESVRSNPECLKCSLRSLCPFCIASAYAETGSTGGKPAYLCEMTEAVYLKMRHMIHQYSR